MDSLGIYIQVPFCASKCSFCNFSSQVVRTAALDPYCNALQAELRNLPFFYEAAGVDDRVFHLPADTIYVGGGSPTILGVGRLKRIVKCVRQRFCVADWPEFTVEVTPGSAGEAWLAKALELGVNRLSIGAQSFVDRELKAVGRLHVSEDTAELVRLARQVGFRNIGLDLVAGLPYQTPDSWQHSLDQLAELRPEHVSVYLFEIDERSRLGKEILRQGTRYHAEAVLDDDFMADAYIEARRSLLSEGYVQYEISNFALPGYESSHNRKYWQLGPYIGLGAGAHSFDGICRWANEHSVQDYVSRLARRQSPIVEHRGLSPEERLEEYFFLGLRQTEGVSLREAKTRWEKRLIDPWLATIDSLIEQGYLEEKCNRIRLTDTAYLISNEVFQEFVRA
ncbi:MAG TPA: radical SAM family heme chaperone HemW [Terriglobia bacterium]|nr:radical SAM family heme chaperone HemW [Terriglobia bacterium]